jgi:16S rRNA (cytosine967-C5)-methyltransferase
MKEENRLRQTIEIIKAYDFNLPLKTFLFSWYKKRPNMGSADRRETSTLVYQCFRLGKNLSNLEIERQIAAAVFLCNVELNYLIEYIIKKHSHLKLEDIKLSLEDKIRKVIEQYPEFNLDNTFPFPDQLSSMIDKNLFIESHFCQPKVWIRIKNGKVEKVLKELEANKYLYEVIKNDNKAIGFKVHYKLDKLKSHINGDFEIQDIGSQKTGKLYKLNKDEIWWDACAGSGGKSLMLADIEPSVSLFITDKRKSILNNLNERFLKAGIKKFKIAECDLLKPDQINYPFESFDGIILDVPCSGSGTWAATPEMLSKFDYKSIAEYHHTQTQIAQNVLPYLKKGKPLIYITCSVYKQENEDVVKFLCDNFNMILESQQIIEGYRYGASTFFVARLIKQ